MRVAGIRKTRNVPHRVPAPTHSVHMDSFIYLIRYLWLFDLFNVIIIYIHLAVRILYLGIHVRILYTLFLFVCILRWFLCVCVCIFLWLFIYSFVFNK